MIFVVSGFLHYGAGVRVPIGTVQFFAEDQTEANDIVSEKFDHLVGMNYPNSAGITGVGFEWIHQGHLKVRLPESLLNKLRK
jgi:hypothetical protein